MKNLRKFWLPIIIAIVTLLIIGGGVYLYNSNQKIYDDVVFCTMDAMECPDGSWVGRTGPNCEFVCPPIIHNNMIRVSQSIINMIVSSPLTITGEARGVVGILKVISQSESKI